MRKRAGSKCGGLLPTCSSFIRFWKNKQLHDKSELNLDGQRDPILPQRALAADIHPKRFLDGGQQPAQHLRPMAAQQPEHRVAVLLLMYRNESTSHMAAESSPSVERGLLWPNSRYS